MPPRLGRPRRRLWCTPCVLPCRALGRCRRRRQRPRRHSAGVAVARQLPEPMTQHSRRRRPLGRRPLRRRRRARARAADLVALRLLREPPLTLRLRIDRAPGARPCTASRHPASLRQSGRRHAALIPHTQNPVDSVRLSSGLPGGPQIRARGGTPLGASRVDQPGPCSCRPSRPPASRLHTACSTRSAFASGFRARSWLWPRSRSCPFSIRWPQRGHGSPIAIGTSRRRSRSWSLS